jgi:lytic starch monooxygenase
VVDVEWCVDHNGDHGGMFAWRICQDQALVNKLLTPGYVPTAAEKQEVEDCFEAGVLRCTDVSGQTCEYSPNCSPGQPCYRNDWFTCKGFDAGDNGRCQGVDRAPIGSCYTTIAGGYTVTKKIRIPNYTSDHTLLSLKWNSYQTGQIYLSCADIAIKGSGGGDPDPEPQPCSAGSKVKVTFNQLTTTSYGDTIKIVGSTAELGSWDPSKALAMSASGYTAAKPLWSLTKEFAPGTQFSYKFIKVSSSGGVSWESDPNRSYTVPTDCSKTYTVESSWK